MLWRPETPLLDKEKVKKIGLHIINIDLVIMVAKD